VTFGRVVSDFSDMLADRQKTVNTILICFTRGGVYDRAVIGKSQIKYLTQILNLSRNRFKSFNQTSNLIFLQIPNLSRSNLKSNLKSFTEVNM